jgi:hypothetical protein
MTLGPVSTSHSVCTISISMGAPPGILAPTIQALETAPFD